MIQKLLKTNLKIIYYLDVTFTSLNGTYILHKNPHDTLQCINTSNYLLQVNKKLPISISEIISMNLSNKETFSMRPNWITKRFWKIVAIIQLNWSSLTIQKEHQRATELKYHLVVYSVWQKGEHFLKLIDLHFLKAINPTRLLTETPLKSVIVAQKTYLPL